MGISTRSLIRSLRDAGDKGLQIQLPGGGFLDPHFHITEVSQVERARIDCGGSLEATNLSNVKLQTLVANDEDHRLRTTNFETFLTACVTALDALGEVLVETQGACTIETYALDGITEDEDNVTLCLGALRTECLAPDKCGIETPATAEPAKGCCGPSGCC